jgi:hypothetical protein
MRLVTIAAVTISFVMSGSVAFAQSRGAHGGMGSRSLSGSRLGSSRPIAIPPPVTHLAHSRGVIVPYPVYYGGYYYTGYYGDGAGPYSQAAPAYDSGYADAAPGQSPVVIVNQGFRQDGINPVTRDYSDVDLPEPGPDYRPAGDQPTIYLLAMTDHSIIPAIAYWTDGDTLNYITTEGVQNRVSLSLIDREFSRQLNDSRHVEFKLPPAK